MSKKTFKETKIEYEDNVARHYASLIFSGLSNKEASEATMTKFNIFSRTTLWSIKKRVAKREELNK